MGKNGTGKKPPTGPTSDPAINAALRRVERDRVQITCPVSDLILMIAGLGIALNDPVIANLDSGRRLGAIINYMTGVVIQAEPALEAMFTDGDPFKT
jgi:hypothetical protein